MLDAGAGWAGPAWDVLYGGSMCPPARAHPGGGTAAAASAPCTALSAIRRSRSSSRATPPPPPACAAAGGPRRWPQPGRRLLFATMPAAGASRPAWLLFVVLALAVGANAIMPNCSLTVDYA
jgi:hypothetical protein